MLFCLNPVICGGKSARLNDAANLLSEREKADLLYKLDEISERQQFGYNGCNRG